MTKSATSGALRGRPVVRECSRSTVKNRLYLLRKQCGLAKNCECVQHKYKLKYGTEVPTKATKRVRQPGDKRVVSHGVLIVEVMIMARVREWAIRVGLLGLPGRRRVMVVGILVGREGKVGVWVRVGCRGVARVGRWVVSHGVLMVEVMIKAKVREWAIRVGLLGRR